MSELSFNPKLVHANLKYQRELHTRATPRETVSYQMMGCPTKSEVRRGKKMRTKSEL